MMDPKLVPFIVSSETDNSSDAPQVALDMISSSRSSELSITTPYTIEFKLRWLQNPHDSAVIFRWTPHESFIRSHLLLLRQTASGEFERIEVKKADIARLIRDEDDTMKVNGYNQDLQELRPAKNLALQIALPENYQKLLVPGERYKLFWPGGEISMWDWGTIREHVGQELKLRSAQDPALKLPRFILPACSGIEFVAKQEDEPWPDRAKYEAKFGFDSANLRESEWRNEMNPPPSPPLLGTDQRIPGAPVLSMTLDGPSQMMRHGDMVITAKVSYEKSVDAVDARPIIFHTHKFVPPYYIYRLRSSKWTKCQTEDSTMTGWIMVDDPDVPVNVSEDSKFVSLKPGEQWTSQCIVQKNDWSHIPDDTVVGDKFKYVFKGTTLDWWDWGDSESHSRTVVMLPCFLFGPVVDPKDNNGRPKLVVPGSNELEFSVV